MYKVYFKKSAAKELSRLPIAVIKRIQKVVIQLEINLFPGNSRKLEGLESFYRIRVGDYRVVYLVEKTVKIVTVTKVGHRREVYKRI